MKNDNDKWEHMILYCTKAIAFVPSPNVGRQSQNFFFAVWLQNHDKYLALVKRRRTRGK